MSCCPWTKEEDAELRTLFATGLSFAKIAALLTSDRKPSRQSCISRAHKLGLRRKPQRSNPRPPIPRKKALQKYADVSNLPPLRSVVYTDYDLKRMTLNHLLDLKRAGHSPSATELHVTPRQAVYVPFGNPTRAI